MWGKSRRMEVDSASNVLYALRVAALSCAPSIIRFNASPQKKVSPMTIIIFYLSLSKLIYARTSLLCIENMKSKLLFIAVIF